MSTSDERTVRIPFEVRTVVISRGSTSAERTIRVTETT